MDIVGKARRLERKIARSVDAALGEFVARPSGSAIEIVHAVVDQAEERVQEAGRGRRVFPFNRILIQMMLPAGDTEGRARFAAVAEGPPSIAQRVRDRLRARGCQVDAPQVEISYVSVPGRNWASPNFHVEFDRVDLPPVPAAAAPSAGAPPRLKMTVVAGAADQRVYAFAGGRIDIGRQTEVFDGRQRLVRRNQVAFAEDNELNGTVSRRHAHIVYAAGEYRLCDDRSSHGTAIVRNGRTIPVPSGLRGTRLQPGDEILLGRARLRVAIEPPRTA
jgi:FHA domain